MPRSGISRTYCLRIVVSLLLAGCTGSTTHHVCALLLAAQGVVTVDGRLIVAPHATDRDSQLCPGTIIRTSADSTAQIACLSNTLVDLSENSTLEIERLTLRKDGNETEDEMEARSVRCRLATGTTTIAYQGAEGVSEFVAVTPQGTLTAKFSCVVRLVVDSQTTRITCANGSAAFEPAEGRPSVLVEAGFVAESTAGGTVVVAATATAAGQQDVTSALEVERQLATLALAKRATLP